MCKHAGHPRGPRYGGFALWIADHPWHYRPDLVYKTSVLLPFDPTASVRGEIERTTGGFIGLITRGRPVNDYYFTTRLTARGPRPTAAEIAEAAEDLAMAIKQGRSVVVQAPGEEAVVAPGTCAPTTPILSAVYAAAAVIAQGKPVTVEKDGRYATATPKRATGRNASLGHRPPFTPRRGYVPQVY